MQMLSRLFSDLDRIPKSVNRYAVRLKARDRLDKRAKKSGTARITTADVMRAAGDSRTI